MATPDRPEAAQIAHLQAALAAATAALDARNAELDEWATRAGHDLMTPLAVISGSAETLEAAWTRLTEADRSRLLASIRTQARRARTLVEEGLELARPPTPMTK